MIRLVRRASLPVTLYLLISAATATADCAWVLWAMRAQAPADHSG